MSDWPIIYPKRRLHSEFQIAVRTCMANAHKAKWERLRGEAQTVSGYSGNTLSTLAGFTQQSELSRILNTEFGASPRIIERLEALARAVGYDGELLADADTEVQPVAATHGASR